MRTSNRRDTTFRLLHGITSLKMPKVRDYVCLVAVLNDSRAHRVSPLNHYLLNISFLHAAHHASLLRSLYMAGLIRSLLVVDPEHRLTAEQALEHPWVVSCGGNLPAVQA